MGETWSPRTDWNLYNFKKTEAHATLSKLHISFCKMEMKEGKQHYSWVAINVPSYKKSLDNDL